MKLGSNLQYLRKLHGNMTQEKLAERMGVSRQTVSKWETGEAVPDVDKLLESYASAMNQTLDQLKEQFNAEQMDYFKHRAQVTKALDMIWDNAKVTEAEETTEA